MNGIGTIINILAVLVGGGFGVVFKGRLKVRYQQVLSQAIGLLLIGIGGYSFIQAYFVISGKKLETDGMFFVIFALAFGLLLGAGLRMEAILNFFGKCLSKKAEADQALDDNRRKKLQEDLQKAVAKNTPKPKIPWLDRSDVYEMPSVRSGNLFADGFVAAVLVTCVSPMLFNGVYADCLDGDTSQMFVKSIIDLVLCFALAYLYGGGVLYAAIPMGIIEAFWTVLFLIVNYIPFGGLYDLVFSIITPSLTAQVTIIGAVLLMGTGICLGFEKKFKVANLIPAFVIPVVYAAIKMYLETLIEK